MYLNIISKYSDENIVMSLPSFCIDKDALIKDGKMKFEI
jgi:hypothetical protein